MAFDENFNYIPDIVIPDPAGINGNYNGNGDFQLDRRGSPLNFNSQSSSTMVGVPSPSTSFVPDLNLTGIVSNLNDNMATMQAKAKNSLATSKAFVGGQYSVDSDNAFDFNQPPLAADLTPVNGLSQELLRLTDGNFTSRETEEFNSRFKFNGNAQDGSSTEGPSFFGDFLKKGGGLDMINGSLNTLTGLYGASLAKKQLDLSKDAMRENMALNRANYENSAKSYNNQLEARNASMRGSTARLAAADNAQLLSQDYRRG